MNSIDGFRTGQVIVIGRVYSFFNNKPITRRNLFNIGVYLCFPANLFGNRCDLDKCGLRPTGREDERKKDQHET